MGNKCSDCNNYFNSNKNNKEIDLSNKNNNNECQKFISKLSESSNISYSSESSKEIIKQKKSILCEILENPFKPLKTSNFQVIYKIEKVIQEDSLGKIWLVLNLKIKINRILKTIKKSLFNKENKLKFFEEIKLLFKLDHPNIIKIYDAFEDEKYYYLIQEYCSGQKLFDRISEVNNFNENKVSKLMNDILSAISYLHKNKLIHRDIRPENFIYSNNSKNAILKLNDLGVCIRNDDNKKLTEKYGKVI